MFSEDLNWWGWFSPFGGYGMVNLEYAAALERLLPGKVTIGWERYTSSGNLMEWPVLTEEHKKLFERPYRKSRIGVIKTTPPQFFHNESDFRIGYTMVENTQIGKEWVEICNTMDAMFTPSEFVKGVFINCGVKRPIYVVKQGIDMKRFQYIDRPKKDKFIFGTCGVQDERKNWKDLVTAFVSEFEPNEPVELWIKNTNPKFGNFAFRDPRIKIINTFYDLDEMIKLYSLFDCFVFPSHAEGSGLPPREAMATGLPTILTNWSGLAEVCDENLNYPLTPVAIDFPEADYRRIEQPGFQARIDVTELMYLMRYVYEHQDEAKAKGLKASEVMRRDWNWDMAASHMLKILSTI